MSFGSRLKELRKAQGFTQETLAEALGVTKGAIGNYEIDANSPKEEIMIKIFKILKAEPNYFFQDSFSESNNILNIESQNIIKKYTSLDEHGKKVVNAVLNAELERIQQEAERTSEYESVMFFDLPVSAGTGVFLDSENCEHVDYPADEVPTGTDFAVRIHGDSMEPLYSDGGTAFVRVQQSVKEGEVGIFVLNGDGYIKRLEKKNGSTFLVSENTAYKPIKILDTDTLSCVGKVLN